MKKSFILLIFFTLIVTQSLFGLDNLSNSSDKKYRVTSFINSKGQDILVNSQGIINNLSLNPLLNSEKFTPNNVRKYDKYYYHRLDGNTYESNDLKNWNISRETPEISAFKYSENPAGTTRTFIVSKDLFLNEKEGSNFEIYSILGQKIEKGNYNGISLEMSEFEDGFYVVIINNNIYKIIKNN